MVSVLPIFIVYKLHLFVDKDLQQQKSCYSSFAMNMSMQCLLLRIIKSNTFTVWHFGTIFCLPWQLEKSDFHCTYFTMTVTE